MSFGKLLQEKRKEQKVSQRQLAERVGVDFTYISKIENEILAPPSEETIQKMADTLHADAIEWIISAGKIPTVFQNLIFNEPNVVSFLRKADSIKKDDWNVIKKMIQEEREVD